MFGDVPRGVMLDQAPIFLGGMSGVVGPVRIGFGSVLAAGGVYRADYDEGLLVLGERRRDGSTAFRPRQLGAIRAKVSKNVLYLGELIALRAWYRHVRPLFGGSDPLTQAVTTAGLRTVEANIDERLKQMDRFRDLVRESLPSGGDPAGEWGEFVRRWDDVRAIVRECATIEGRAQLRDGFCERLAAARSSSPGYTAAIQALGDSERRQGTEWLASVRSDLVGRCRAMLPIDPVVDRR
jgi:UDP-N-acetylglucosamine/UDP-N-acetylgalactosamine diphosphorylase